MPPGFVLTTAAYRTYVDRSGIGDEILALGHRDDAADRIRALFTAPVPEALAEELRAARAELGPAVAVRSSATAEDLEDASFAGQQDTFLNVRGDDALLDAVRDCWASLWTARAIAYRARRGIDPAEVALAVVVQEMVDADAAGVLFTANPTTGARDEVVIAAAWGLGEAVVGGSVTTDDIVVEKGGGRIRSRTTADKAVQTVAVEQGTEDRPVPAADRARAVLDDAEAAALAALGVRIEEWFGAPQDVEWARAGGAFAIVQSRPITALPEAAAPPPTDWPVPDPSSFYVRASIVEQLPDPLSPLFAELVDGSVTRSLQALFGELLGRSDVIRSGDVALPTVNGYAYYRYSRRGMVRVTLASFPAFRALLRRGRRACRSGGGSGRTRSTSGPWSTPRRGRRTACPNAALLDDAAALLDAGTTYYTAVQTIIPLAATSETTFTRFYERLVRRAGDPPAPTFLLGFDSAPIRAEQSLYDLAAWTRDAAGAHRCAARGVAGRHGRGDRRDAPPAGVDARTGRSGATGSSSTWPGTGTPSTTSTSRSRCRRTTRRRCSARCGSTWTAAARTRRNAGSGPAQRRAEATRRSRPGWARCAGRRSAGCCAGRRRWRRCAKTPSPTSGSPGRSCGGCSASSARRLVGRGCRGPGGRRVLAAPRGDPRRSTRFRARRSWRSAGRCGGGSGGSCRRRSLPRGSWWERAFARWLPAASDEQTGAVLRGIGASTGQVTATARVLGGPADFGRLQPGDVLVASITTPAWTSLFAMAAAVVTDIGGPLSHSSIVAREYGIPAVLGTNVATRRIPDGARVRVDGDTGTVTLLDGCQESA